MTVELRCERADCGRAFDADPTDDTARCPACGREHDVPDVDDAAATGPPAEPDQRAETALEVGAGATVTVTITVEVHGGDDG